MSTKLLLKAPGILRIKYYALENFKCYIMHIPYLCESAVCSVGGPNFEPSSSISP